MRRTELSTLNDEAENFMFGEKKDDMSADNSSESNQSEEVGRKKRRTHAELFINDNADYYKFELPGSRLRFVSSVLCARNNTCLALKINLLDGAYPGLTSPVQLWNYIYLCYY